MSNPGQIYNQYKKNKDLSQALNQICQAISGKDVDKDDSLKDKIIHLENLINDLSRNCSNNKSLVTSLDTKLTHQEGKNANNETNISELKNTVSKNEKEIKMIKDNLIKSQTFSNNLQSILSDMKQKLDFLEKDNAAKTTQIKACLEKIKHLENNSENNVHNETVSS